MNADILQSSMHSGEIRTPVDCATISTWSSPTSRSRLRGREVSLFHRPRSVLGKDEASSVSDNLIPDRKVLRWDSAGPPRPAVSTRSNLRDVSTTRLAPSRKVITSLENRRPRGVPAPLVVAQVRSCSEWKTSKLDVHRRPVRTLSYPRWRHSEERRAGRPRSRHEPTRAAPASRS